MRHLERICFITPTATKDVFEIIAVGEEYWDFGVCEAIKEHGESSFIAHFNRNNKEHLEFVVNDVKRRLYVKDVK